MAEKKRTHVEISVEEQLLIVKGYVKNRCNRPSVYADVKQAIDRLPKKCQALYKDGPFEKVKRRMSDNQIKGNGELVADHRKIAIPIDDEIDVVPNDQAGVNHNQVVVNREEAVFDQAVMNHDQVVVNNDQAVINNDQAVVNRDQAVVNQEQAVVNRDQAVVNHDQAVVNNDQVVVNNDQVNNDQELANNDQAELNNDQVVKENEQDDHDNGPTPPKRKPISELARDAYETYIKMQERVPQFEDKMSKSEKHSIIMASAAHICGICDLRHVTKPTVSWCSECDEGFCSDCVEHHSLAKATRHHKTMPMDDYQTLPPEVLQIPQSCTKHDEKFILYCKDHELPCCGKCAMECHKGCSQVINLEDIVKNAKTSTSFQEIEEKLAEVVYNIKKIQNVYRGNITTFSENRKQIEKQIQVIRFKIDTHLNEIQDTLLDELKEVENAETKKFVSW
ncbi:unnamed protein product [Mytilus edulis]|uniref:B box-type domain-containing protein n=1 Tax=Mytilus edulis TaxID=6550 RepID=A0A8S3VKE7_MYTED|nr:unnamed protein product [Mytilus edulis]